MEATPGANAGTLIVIILLLAQIIWKLIELKTGREKSREGHPKKTIEQILAEAWTIEDRKMLLDVKEAVGLLRVEVAAMVREEGQREAEIKEIEKDMKALEAKVNVHQHILKSQVANG